MRKWYASINSAPGFTTEAFQTLKLKADEEIKKGKRMHVNLIFDEMSIRQHAQWNPNKLKFDGFIDMGLPATDGKPLALAKDALVFLVSGVTEDFKIPVAYFLTNGLIAEEKAALLNEVLIRLADIKAVVVAITFDGLVSNLAMCKLMGADFGSDCAHIVDPVNKERKIYIILDPAHMLKLMRNCIGTRNLVDANGDLVEWRYIQKLYETQKDLPYNLCTKLTKDHMQWASKKMSVRLAGETLSNSVADLMEFLSNESEDFKDAKGTIKFIRMVNNCFDVMNSTTLNASTKFKMPLSMSNHIEAFDLFKEAMPYLKSIRVESETNVIFSSMSRTPFMGFYYNMVNFVKIFDAYVRTKKIEFLITHRFSQDLIETLFGCIRGMGGTQTIFLYVYFVASVYKFD